MKSIPLPSHLNLREKLKDACLGTEEELDNLEHLFEKEWKKREALIISLANSGAMQKLTSWKAELYKEVEELRPTKKEIRRLSLIGLEQAWFAEGIGFALDQVLFFLEEKRKKV